MEPYPRPSTDAIRCRTRRHSWIVRDRSASNLEILSRPHHDGHRDANLPVVPGPAAPRLPSKLPATVHGTPMTIGCPSPPCILPWPPPLGDDLH